VRPESAHVLTRYPDRAGCHRQQAGDDPGHRGLACAVGPQDRDHLTGLHAQAHAVERDRLAVARTDAVELEQGRRRRLGALAHLRPLQGCPVTEVDGAHGGVGRDLIRGAGGDDLAPVDDDDALGQLADDRLDVLHHQERDTLGVDPTDDVDHLLGLVLHEPRADLVQEQHARVQGQRPGHLEPLEVEQPEASRRTLGLVRQAAQLEHVQVAQPITPGQGADVDVLLDRHADEGPRHLVGQRDPRARDAVRRPAEHRLPVEQHVTAVQPDLAQ
jgi:hypothetical protein